MKLEEGEYTTQSFISYLTEKYGNKVSGEPFTTNDIAQYLIRGYTPYRYGGIKIKSKVQEGVRFISTKVELEEVKEKKSTKKAVK